MADPIDDPVQVLALGTKLTDKDSADIDFHTWMADITDRVNFLFPLSGAGSPEGAVESPPRRFYVDTSVSPADMYFKATGDGDTGWVIIS